MTKPDIEQLQRLTIFSGLPSDHLTEISKIVRERRYRKGMFVMVEGEPADGLCLVHSGRLKITKSDTDGREQILRIAEPGDIFGEVILFDAGPAPATAEVLEDASIGLIRNPDLAELVRAHPDLAWELLRDMSRKLRHSQEQVRNLALKDVSSRIASTLLQLVRDSNPSNIDRAEIAVPITRQHLAGLVGTTRESVSRVLGQMESEDLIRLERGSVVIKNRAGLVQWGE